MILLVDNYDSFVYNLYQFIGSINPNIKVIRNDEMTIEEIKTLDPEMIILSPGPGKPKDAGIMEDIIRAFYQEKRILGVCLGHQAICEAFGGEIVHANKIMHGKTSMIHIDTSVPLFQGLNEVIPVARYHSLVAKKETLPKELKIIGISDDEEIMAVKHRDYPIYGLQFHPESFLTKDGMQMIQQFLGGKEND